MMPAICLNSVDDVVWPSSQASMTFLLNMGSRDLSGEVAFNQSSRPGVQKATYFFDTLRKLGDQSLA